jgi:PucR family transcriptional regulator, purine catabolism regulatory protein
MPMTVRELVDDPALGLRVVVDGALDRTIRWVHTTELADPARYLQGGELILTTGVWRDAGVTSSRFVAPLRKTDVAALGYGIPTADGDVPADLERACRRARLPLIAVPFELPFIAVTRAFVDREYGRREDALRARVRRNDELVRAAGHGSGLQGILDVLDRRLGAWVSGPGTQVTASGPLPLDEDAAAVRAAVAGLQPDYPIAAGRWLAYPIVTVGRTEAHLVVAAGRRGPSEDDRAAIDQALPFLGLELARRRALRESERRLASELVDLIMAGPGQQQAAAARLETFFLDAGRPLAAIVCETEDPDAGLDSVEMGLADAGAAAVAAVKAPEIVAVGQWDADEPDLATLAAALHERLGGAVGVGGLAADAGGLRASIVEARHACRFARLRRDAGWATHHQVGSHSLLLALQDEDVLAAFRRALLQPLEEHDARRHSQLVETLDRFLSSGCRWQRTAAELHVHVNTLRHRLARIEQLTGRDLGSMEDRVDLWIALRSRG